MPTTIYTDTLATSLTKSLLVLTKGVGAISDKIDTDGDVDWIKFTCTKDIAYRFSLTGDGTNGTSTFSTLPVLSVVGSTGKSLSTSSSTSGLTYYSEKGGDVFIKIAGSAVGDYKVSATQLVDEGGATASTAKTLTLSADGNASAGGEIQWSGDKDAYKLSLVAGKAWDIKVASDNGSKLGLPSLTLLDAKTGKPITDLTVSSDSSTGQAYFRWSGSTNTDALVVVSGISDAIGTYKVTATQILDEALADKTTTAVLKQSTTTQWSASGAFNWEGDKDWFKLDVPKLQTSAALTKYVLNVTDGNGKALNPSNATLKLLDSAGKEISQGIASDGTLKVTAGTSYFLELADKVDQIGIGNYQLKVIRSGDDYSGDSTKSGNIAISATANTGSSTGQIESEGDVDWFKIDLAAKTGYTFSLQGKDGSLTPLLSGDATLTLLDAQGKQLSTDSGHVGSVEYLTTKSGSYYLKVAATEAAKIGTGQLDYKLVATKSYQDGNLGSSGNDIFKSIISAITNNNTFSNSYSLDGGAGYDTLKLSIESIPSTATSYITPILKNIEEVVISPSSTASKSDRTSLYLNLGSVTNVTVNGDFSSALPNQLTIKTPDINPTITLASKGLSYICLDNDYPAYNKMSPTTQNINLQGFSGNVTTDSSVKTINLPITSSSTNASVYTYAYGSFDTINITGNQTATLTTKAVSINADKYAGNLIISDDYLMSAILGAGNDTLTPYGLSEGSTLNGGSGTDTLVIYTKDLTEVKTQHVTGFETLRFRDYGSVNASLLNGISRLEFGSNYWYENGTISGLISSQTLVLGDGITSCTPNISASAKVNTSTDVLNLEINKIGSSSYAAKVTANDFETVNIQTKGTSTNYLSVAGTSVSTINLSGSCAIDIDSAPNSLKLNAASMTATVEINAGTGTLEFKGGSANDRVVMSSNLDITDKLDGGLGNDTLSISDLRTLTTALTDNITSFETLELQGTNAAADLSAWSPTGTVILNNYGDFIVQNHTSQLFTISNASSLTVTPESNTSSSLAIKSLDSSWTLSANQYKEISIEFDADSAYETSGYVQLQSIANDAIITVTNTAAITGGIDIRNNDYYNKSTAFTIDGKSLTTAITYAGNSSSNENIYGGSGNDTLNAAYGSDTVNGGTGNDLLKFSQDRSYYNGTYHYTNATLTGGSGSDTFYTSSYYNGCTGYATITDLDLGSINTSVDKLSIAQLSATSLIDAEIAKYKGGTPNFSGKKIIILNDGNTYTLSTAEAKIAGGGYQGKAIVFWADSNQKVHVSYDGDTGTSNYSTNTISDLFLIDNLTIDTVGTNLSYLDFA